MFSVSLGVNILNKKTIIFISSCILLISVFVIIAYGKSILRLFKQSTNLNYHAEIAYIELGKRFSEDGNDIRIDAREDIEKILNYLNSLELIEENVTRFNPYDLIADGYFTIDIIRKGDENANLYVVEGEKVISYSQDLLSFRNDYMSFTPNYMDWKSTRYYIVNSGYDDETKNSNVYQFLYNLINE